MRYASKSNHNNEIYRINFENTIETTHPDIYQKMTRGMVASKPENLNYQDEEGNTLLHYCCLFGEIKRRKVW